MAYENSDNGAHLGGYTEEYMAEPDGPFATLHISVKPGTDFDTCFRAFDHDNQEYIWIKGWRWDFTAIEDCLEA